MSSVASSVTSLVNTINARFLLRQPAAHRAQNGFTLDVDLTLPASAVTAIVGASGSGKTTLLRCVAGLTKADSGELVVNGEVWQNAHTFRPTHKRAIGYVFQEPSLFPHLSAEGNLRYAIKRADQPVSVDFYAHTLEVMGIAALLSHYPAQLSGGERQRVAIARALLIQPQLLLMDEPLASLDNARKQEILPLLERLRSEFKMPVLYVSHALDEVARLADHVVVLSDGRVLSQGPIVEVFSRLDSPFSPQEQGVIIEAIAMERDSQWHLVRTVFEGGVLWLKDSGAKIGQTVRVRIMAKDVSLTLSPQQHSSILNRLEVTLSDIAQDPEPAMLRVRLQAGNHYILAHLTRKSADSLGLVIGQKLWAQIKAVAIVG